ncbi:MAG: M1 family metallopeptidase [Clostridia bacterium]|nr:M1 family metallopeptidase [Clostridia bacterium]
MRQRLSPEEKRQAWLWAALIVLMMLAAGIGGYRLCAYVREPSPALPAESEELLEAARGLDSIRITAALDPGLKRLDVTQEMMLCNRTGQEQASVVLRSWTGAYRTASASPAATDELFASCYGAVFDPGGLVLQSVRVNGSPVLWHWLDDAQTVLSLPVQWPEGTDASVTLTYHVDIPGCASRFGYAEGVFMLGNVFPVAAVWADGAWRTDPYAGVGDPFMSECANWTVQLSVPAGYTAAASAYAVPVETEGRWRYDFSGSALRDFALVVSDRFVAVQGMADGTLVTAYARRRDDAEAILRYARQAMESYGRRWGSYVYPSFTLTEAVFPYGGMEYPGMVMLASQAMGGLALEQLVAHETAHQWWAVMVGSDSFHQPWQDESLCEYAMMDYIGDVYGASVRASAVFDRIETSLRITVPRGVTPGSPVSYFADLAEYEQVVYQRGAALWTALEKYLGKAGLDALLKDYLMQYRFRIALRDDLTALISQHAGQDMSGLLLDYLDTYI